MPPGFRMEIGADRGEVARVNAAVGEFADAHALPAAVRRSMNVALDDLLTNTVAHGLAGRDDGRVAIAVELQPDRLVVTLTDNGRAFDPFGRDAPDTTLSVADRPIGGLGIHLVRKLLDDVSYERRGDTNVVVLAKRLAAGESQRHRGGRAMEITTRAIEDVTIVAVAGNLDSITSPEAQQAIDAILANGVRKLAVDFSRLDYISSAGLRVLLGAAKKVGAAGGALRLFGLNETVREVFDVSGFSTILAVFPGEAEARRGF